MNFMLLFMSIVFLFVFYKNKKNNDNNSNNKTMGEILKNVCVATLSQ